MSFKDNSIPFSYFCELIINISLIKPKTIKTRLKLNSIIGEGIDNRSNEKLKCWIKRLNEIIFTNNNEIEINSASTSSRQFSSKGTGLIFFRLLFPEVGVRRRYMMKEESLIKQLEIYFKVKKGKFDNWCNSTSSGSGSGCLGTQVELYLLSNKFKGKLPVNNTVLTFGRIDELLDELASKCSYSSKEVISYGKRTQARDFTSIFKSLLDPLNSSEISIVIQIILRDLTPLLYPPPNLTCINIALNKFNTKAYSKINLFETMFFWDNHSNRMKNLFKIKEDLDFVTMEVERLNRTNEEPKDLWKPVIGIPVQVPKSERPGIPSIATKRLHGKVSVETKYDGERLQIHIDTSLPYLKQIQIFSKSGRDSTVDRQLLLPIIRSSLNLPQDLTNETTKLDSRLFQRNPNNKKSKSSYLSQTQNQKLSPKKYILEGEMVVFNEPEDRIDEYWKLNAVKKGSIPHSSHSTIISPNSNQNQQQGPQLASSQDSYKTGETESYDRSLERRRNEIWFERRKEEKELHLMIVWFDLLLVDQESLLSNTYEERRSKLENLVQVIHGFSMLADRIIINFDQPSALYQLRHRFAHIIVCRGEGLMLKPLTSKYNDYKKGQKWLKLKKDFIPGAGDTLDFNILGARWDKKRGRDLGVGPAVMTTFYVGLKCDSPLTTSSRGNSTSKPHYHILFTSSFGLDRNQLEGLNFDIQKFNDNQSFETGLNSNSNNQFQTISPVGGSNFSIYTNPEIDFTFSLGDHLNGKQDRPTCIFKKVKVFEMVGAGFQCSMGSPYYELRWPRIIKINRENGEPVDLERLQEIAREAMQFNTIDLIDQIWPLSTSNSTSSFNNRLGGGEGRRKESLNEKLEREINEWILVLEKADKVLAGGGNNDDFNEISRLEAATFNFNSSGSNSTSTISSGIISKIRPQEFDDDEGYASFGEDRNVPKRIKRLVPFGSVTNLTENLITSNSNSSCIKSLRRKIIVVEPTSIEMLINPSNSSTSTTTTTTNLSTPTQLITSVNTTPISFKSTNIKFTTNCQIPIISLLDSSPPPSPNSSPLACSVIRNVKSSVSVSSSVASSVASSVSISVSTSVSTCRKKKLSDSGINSVSIIASRSSSISSFSPSWEVSTSILSSLLIDIISTSHSWTFIFPKSSTTTTSEPKIPNLIPFQKINFFFDPFHVLLLSGWLGINHFHYQEDELKVGILIVLNEKEGRNLKFNLLHKFGVKLHSSTIGSKEEEGKLIERKKLLIISLNGWNTILN